jgi:hypothetical protein
LQPDLRQLRGPRGRRQLRQARRRRPQAFEERFVKEVWPLLSRNGKDGCVGCHKGKLVSALHLSGDPAKDFRMLLREGFFLVDDKGSLVGRITDKDVKRRMPLERPAWKEDEIAVLRKFTLDLDKKQNNKK